MSALTRFLPRERRALVADALLVATAVGGAALGLLTLWSELAPESGWYEPVSLALMAVVVLVCPWVAWRLHGRRTTRSAVPGIVIGALFAGLVVLATAWLVAVVAAVGSWLTGGAVSQGLVALVVTTAAVVLLVAWLDTDAVRDLARARHHVGLDVERLLATVVALATAAGTLWWASSRLGEEPAELLEFSLVFGVAAATVALGADLFARPPSLPAPPA
jgi:hypothetical protein